METNATDPSKIVLSQDDLIKSALAMWEIKYNMLKEENERLRKSLHKIDNLCQEVSCGKLEGAWLSEVWNIVESAIGEE